MGAFPNHQWAIPLNFTFGKTVIWSGRPWKLSMEVNYFVENADSFGPERFVGFNVAPVVENVLASWFKWIFSGAAKIGDLMLDHAY